MSDQAPLSTSFDTTTVKVGKPTLFDGWQGKVRFVSCGEKTFEGKGTVISFEYHTLDMASDIDGKAVNPGFRVYDAIYLWGKDGEAAVKERAVTKMSKIIDAFLGTGDIGNKKGRPQRPAFDAQTIANLIGKEAYIKVKVNTGERDGNDITKYTALADMQA